MTTVYLPRGGPARCDDIKKATTVYASSNGGGSVREVKSDVALCQSALAAAAYELLCRSTGAERR
jgi:hypothetical protein